MKYTLLELTQNILSAINGDEIDSIGDSVVSEQVAIEIRTSYFANIDNLNIPTFSGLIQLDGLADTDHPNYLTIPETVKNIEWFKYNANTVAEPMYKDIPYKAPKDFLDLVFARDSTDDNVQLVTDDSGVKLIIQNDRFPTHWTVFDNNTLITDSFDSDLETTLHANKSACFGQFIQDWSHVDGFTPPLDDNGFTQLLADAKSACFLNIKQVSNVKEEKRARVALIRSQNDRWRANQRDFTRSPDFGRRKP